MGLRGPRGLGRVFGKRLAARRYGYKVDRKCQQRHPIVYSSLPKPTITDPAERTATLLKGRNSASMCANVQFAYFGCVWT